jgi:hypothetical protein
MVDPIYLPGALPPEPYGGVPPQVQKPSSITIVAIFAIAFGSLGVLCCGVGGIISVMFFSAAPLPNGSVIQLDPGVRAINTVFALLDVLISGILLTCGIGAFSLKPWARQLGVIIAAVILLLAVAKVGIAIGYSGEKTERYMKEVREAVAAEQRKQGANAPAQPFGEFGSAVSIGVGLLMLILQATTPVLILVFWTKPRIKAWFGGQPAAFL